MSPWRAGALRMGIGWELGSRNIEANEHAWGLAHKKEKRKVGRNYSLFFFFFFWLDV
jgi:hypothetical protein